MGFPITFQTSSALLNPPLSYFSLLPFHSSYPLAYPPFVPFIFPFHLNSTISPPQELYFLLPHSMGPFLFLDFYKHFKIIHKSKNSFNARKLNVKYSLICGPNHQLIRFVCLLISFDNIQWLSPGMAPDDP